MKIKLATVLGKQPSLLKLTNLKAGFRIATGGQFFLNAHCTNIFSIAGLTAITELTQQTGTIAVDLGEKKRL